MRKKVEPDLRKITFTVSLAPALVRRLEHEASELGISRSALIRKAIDQYLEYADIMSTEMSDDVSEIGYNPYTGSYEEDL